MQRLQKYWFPAKKYGWGWGFPSTWQGWLVLFAYVVTLGALAIVLGPQERPLPFFICAAIATAILVVICLVKGERPRWGPGSK